MSREGLQDLPQVILNQDPPLIHNQVPPLIHNQDPPLMHKLILLMINTI